MTFPSLSQSCSLSIPRISPKEPVATFVHVSFPQRPASNRQRSKLDNEHDDEHEHASGKAMLTGLINRFDRDERPIRKDDLSQSCSCPLSLPRISQKNPWLPLFASVLPQRPASNQQRSKLDNEHENDSGRLKRPMLSPKSTG